MEIRQNDKEKVIGQVKRETHCILVHRLDLTLEAIEEYGHILQGPTHWDIVGELLQNMETRTLHDNLVIHSLENLRAVLYNNIGGQ